MQIRGCGFFVDLRVFVVVALRRRRSLPARVTSSTKIGTARWSRCAPTRASRRFNKARRGSGRPASGRASGRTCDRVQAGAGRVRSSLVSRRPPPRPDAPRPVGVSRQLPEGVAPRRGRLPLGESMEYTYRAFSQPQWSPDGVLVALLVTNGGTSWVEVFEASAAGSSTHLPRRTTPSAWGGDGRDLKMGDIEIHLPATMTDGTGRQAYLDRVRGLAVLIMVEAHVLDSWTLPVRSHPSRFRLRDGARRDAARRSFCFWPASRSCCPPSRSSGRQGTSRRRGAACGTGAGRCSVWRFSSACSPTS